MSNIFEPDDQLDFDPLEICSKEYEQLLNGLLSHHGPNLIPNLKNLPDEEFFKAWGMRMGDVDGEENNKMHRLYEIRMGGIRNIRIANLFSRTDVQSIRFRIWRFINADME